MSSPLTRNEIARDHAGLLRFATGGRAVLTMSNASTNRHVTLKLAMPRETKINHRTGRPWPKCLFVRIFIGNRDADGTVPNSQRSYAYVGRILLEDNENNPTRPTLKLDPYKLRGARIAADDPRVKAIEFLVQLLREEATQPADLTIYHEGRCCFCGLALTQTESVKRGYGPDCADQRALPYGTQTRYAKGNGPGVVDVLKTPCGHCGAEAGSRCHGPRGKERRPHSKRIKATKTPVVKAKETVEVDGVAYAFVD